MRDLRALLRRLELRLAADATPEEPECPDLPQGHRCDSYWHIRPDGGVGTAYQRCPRSVAARREAAAAAFPGTEAFDSFEAIREPEAFSAARGWAEVCPAEPAKLALIRGDNPQNTGCGKTHLLKAAARELTRSGLWVEIVIGRDLTAAVRGRASYDQAERGAAEVLVKKWLACDVLILDDLGQEETAGPITAAFLVGILNEREGKSLALASNMSENEISSRYGPPLTSRLLGGALVPSMRGKDYRRSGGRSIKK